MADDKSKKTIPEQINIMKAAEAGAPIIVKAYDARRWSDVNKPAFNWGTSDYKVALDYTDLFGSAVASINYEELYNTLYCLERGRKLGNSIDYSINILEDSKTKIANNVNLKFNEEYNAIHSDIVPDTIKDTQVYKIVLNSLRDKYYRVAEEDIENDTSILSEYGSLNAYFDNVYAPKVTAEMAKLVGDLNTTLKNLTNDSAIQSLVNISNDTIDDIILQQKSTPETDLYENKADSIDKLKQRMSSVMTNAVEKYNNMVDDTYAVSYDDDIRVTIKKQLNEPEPAISINYSLFNYALNGDENPQMDWGFNDEGKVVTVTGITSSEAQNLVNTFYTQFINELKKEEAARKQNDTSIINRVSQTEATLSSRVDSFIDGAEKELDAFEARIESDLDDLKQNGVFNNLSATNPIHGSLIGDSVTVNKETVSGDISTKTLSASDSISATNKVSTKDISATNSISGKSASISNNISANSYFKTLTVPRLTESVSYVLFLGQVLEVGSTAVNSPYNWDISGKVTFVRSSGHNVGQVEFIAGHGYSHSWKTYINLNKVEAHGVSIEPVTFVYNGVTWLGIKVYLSNSGYDAGITLDYIHGNPGEYSRTMLGYSGSYQGTVVSVDEIKDSIQRVPESWIASTKIEKLETRNAAGNYQEINSIIADNINTEVSNRNSAISTAVDDYGFGVTISDSAIKLADFLASIANTSKTNAPARHGSVNLSNGPVGNCWYTWFYIPHRSGIGGDNYKFGTLYLSAMTAALNVASTWVCHYNSGSWTGPYSMNDPWISKTWVDVSSLNSNTWFPVVGTALSSDGVQNLRCTVQLNSGTKPAWATHGQGFSVEFEVQEQRSGWGSTPATCIKFIDNFSWTQAVTGCTNQSPVSYTQLTNSSVPVFYLRGGGKYLLESTYICSWSVKSSKYTINDQSVEPSANTRPTPRGIYIVPSISVAAGKNINSVGTPSVTASTSGSNTTFTFDYLKGAKGDKGDRGPQGPQGPKAPLVVEIDPSTTPTTNGAIWITT